MNNKIKVAKRSAYGDRDENYFLTLIRKQSSLGFPTIPLKANLQTIKPLSQ